MGKDKKAHQTLYCSFCGKSRHKVRKLIAGPTVFICDECVNLCTAIINEDELTAYRLSHKDHKKIFAQLRTEIAAVVKRRLTAEQDDGGNDGGDQD